MIYYNCIYEREKWSVYILLILIYRLILYICRKILVVNIYIYIN